MLGLDFHVFFIFCLHRALYKIYTEKLFVYGKIKCGRKSLRKKMEKKNRPRLRKKGYHCQIKKKIPLWKRLVLAELHAGVLLNAPPCDQTCLKWLTFPGKSWSIVIGARRSRCPIGLRFQEAKQSPGVARVVCESLWAKISHLIFWKTTTTLSEFIGHIDLTDFRQISS